MGDFYVNTIELWKFFSNFMPNFIKNVTLILWA